MNVQAIGATENTLQSAVADLDSLQALRRIVALLESQGCVDAVGRQRVTIDAGTLPNLSTVASVTALGTIAGWDHHQFMDAAQNCFANSIRRQLN